MNHSIKLEIEFWDVPQQLHLRGTVERDMLATDDADNEENAVRMAEQFVREGFRRWREKKATNNAGV